ncbi:MAG: hypothetical protein FJ054_05900 [Cyanobacteria bacterium M_surface_10_m2_119]|nr:hypothetical protein [Cyanobacteria bacterium M_surface_10_m2_119]
MTQVVSLSEAEAFAAIPLAAVCCDQTFAREEAALIREQLMSRSPYRTMEPYALGLLISGLLQRLRTEAWQGLVAAAVPLLNISQQETAFALACQLIHCDRVVSASEVEFLHGLAVALCLSPSRSHQIMEVCALLNRDCLAE